MIRMTILSLTAVFAVATTSTSADAGRLFRPHHTWIKPSNPATSAIKGAANPCGTGMFVGGNGQCYPLLH